MQMHSLFSGNDMAHCRPIAGEVAAQLAGLGMVKCMAFSRSGRLLALGGDDGSLTVLDWPTLRVRAELRCALLSTTVEFLLLPSTPAQH